MNKYQGSCHCGAVTYRVEGDFSEGLDCNCSHCHRKGLLLSFVPESQFELLSGGNNLTTYHFNKHHIDHTFCKTCGVQSFACGHDGNKNYMIAINLNCLENFDSDVIKINKYDGKSV